MGVVSVGSCGDSMRWLFAVSVGPKVLMLEAGVWPFVEGQGSVEMEVEVMGRSNVSWSSAVDGTRWVCAWSEVAFGCANVLLPAVWGTIGECPEVNGAGVGMLPVLGSGSTVLALGAGSANGCRGLGSSVGTLRDGIEVGAGCCSWNLGYRLSIRLLILSLLKGSRPGLCWTWWVRYWMISRR